MSFITHSRLTTAGYSLEDGRRAAAYVPAWRARAIATVRQVALDRRPADGAETTDDCGLADRAWQLTRANARERLADALEAIVSDAERSRARGLLSDGA